jgi:hypothetical protein
MVHSDGGVADGGVAKWFVGAAVIAAGVAQVGLFSSSILPLMPRFAGAPFVRMKSNVVDCLFDRALPRALLRGGGGGVGDGDDVLRGLRLVDMGSGDGRVVVAAAARGMDAVGWELNPVLVAASRVTALQAAAAARMGAGAAAGGGGGSARFRTTNFWDASASLEGADVVTFYALPELIERLQAKLVGELAPGALAVSHRFPVTDWRPLFVTAPKGDPDAHPLFVYDVHEAEQQKLAGLRRAACPPPPSS